MSKVLLLLLSLAASFALRAQEQTALEWQKEMNSEFADSLTSPLTEADRAIFDGLPFYPIDSSYRVRAFLQLTPDSTPFIMATTTGRKAHYRQYAWAHFSLKGDSLKLPIYQSLRLLKKVGYADYLFLPFTDATNGVGSYGGGRYVSLRMPEEGSKLVIDFNKAYNPYCAYNERYSCPIPPKANHLKVAVEAGVKAPVNH